MPNIIDQLFGIEKISGIKTIISSSSLVGLNEKEKNNALLQFGIKIGAKLFPSNY